MMLGNPMIDPAYAFKEVQHKEIPSDLLLIEGQMEFLHLKPSADSW